ncbi:helix-turn-helix transcriptional regulator [Lentilactobacillus otakiensis]|jgi:putative transcriptional regulator|nr:helix-turn-helix transcriptional regulator [Lentilactobacillus otakiensis]MBZ3776951.1 helix-turn-helix transcriptional regulator [Lentilactobacillus otakiensis]MDV3517871.1 helix-turn-helix transcriptional regulator [Lentilactobacillus otakiensis]
MIQVNLDRVLVEQKMTSKELAEKIGITTVNLSKFKTGKAKGVRFNTLNKLCATLNCQPGDILEYTPDESNEGKGNFPNES